jgi:hypothetical protein
MKILSFLAGMAAGLMLQRSLSAPAAGAHQPDGADGVRDATAERDVPIHARQRTDAQVQERIRSQLDRTIAGAEGIQVEVQGGCVTLRGQVQARDVVLLMAEVENTAGVTEVRNLLDVQGSLDEVAPPMTRDRPEVREAERATSHMS